MRDINMSMCQTNFHGPQHPAQAFYQIFNPTVGTAASYPPNQPLVPMIVSPYHNRPDAVPFPRTPMALHNNYFLPKVDSNNNAKTFSKSHHETGGNHSSSSSDSFVINNNLIVNYIPSEMTDVEFGRMFMSFGALESIKLMHDPNTNCSLGYGFVKFVHQEDAEKAVRFMNGLRIGNKAIKVSYARPSCASIKNANLYVNNLPSSICTNSQLDALFSKFGSIITSRLLFDMNLKPRGIGFVRFNLKQEADTAVKAMNGIFLEGSNAPLVVKLAKNTAKNGGMNFAAPPLTPRPQPVNNYVLFVNNLDVDVDETTLLSMFSRFGFIVDLSIIRNHWKKNYAFVTMQNLFEARNACYQLNGARLGSKQIHVSFKRNK